MSQFIAYAPSIALLFFLGTWLWILFGILRPGAKQRLQSHSRIPLEEHNDR